MDKLDLDALALIGARALVDDGFTPSCDGPACLGGECDYVCERYDRCVERRKDDAETVLTAIDLPATIRRAKAEAYEDAIRIVNNPPDEGPWNIAAAIRQRAGEVTG